MEKTVYRRERDMEDDDEDESTDVQCAIYPLRNAISINLA